MSETSQGEGWWQASDLLWYPPRDGSGPGSGGEGSGGRGWLLPTVLVVVVALVAVGVTFVVAGGGDEAAAESVALEPVASVGVDPFTDSVAVNEVAEFPESVSAVIDDTVGELPTDEVTGTLVAAGSTPGLYGGTTDDSACDLVALEGFLTDPANAAKAAAWAGAAGVAESDIGVFLSELAPTVLTLDTRVTNHGFRDGKATPRQSVLQAGSAVLVDALGVPRVRCSCGNPLAEPEQLDLAAAETTGAQWAAYSPGRTAIAQPASDPQNSLTLLDTTTADTYQAPVGQNATWVATAGDHYGTSDGGGGIFTSTDGATWEQTLDSPERLNAVAYDDGLFVAVGEAGTSVEQSGVVYTSADGHTWSDPISVPQRLADVAYGNGQWVAISYNGAAGSFDSGTPVLTSPDGSTWTEGTPSPTEPMGVGDSLSFSSGRFMLMGLSCGNGRNSPGCEPWYLLESEDGSTWTESATSPLGSVGFIGESIELGSSDDDLAIIGEDASYRLEASTWAVASSAPTGFDPQGLSGSGGTWFSVGAIDYAAPTSGVWTSEDLSAWTQIATVDAALTDIAVSGTAAPPPSEPVPTEPPATTPPTTAPPATEAPATGKVDFSSPFLGLYDTERGLVQLYDGPERLARDVVALSQATGITWTDEMVIALATTRCTDAGAPDVATALGIPLNVAEAAFTFNLETMPPCG